MRSEWQESNTHRRNLVNHLILSHGHYPAMGCRTTNLDLEQLHDRLHQIHDKDPVPEESRR